jgi:membrane peptidoglycan carboxypeptidase
VPRGGRFAEGIQPGGLEGWTRPLAMEPVLIGQLVGPDSEIREHLPIEEAPPILLDAIVAAEDGRFFQHSGVNVQGLLRATMKNIQSGGFQQGASTLTMQVVRALTQKREKTLKRKLGEMAKAVALDGHLGKEGTLQIYLDAPYLGQLGSYSICGFQAGARHYWGKDIDQLTLAQTATLAAILPAPGRFAPDKNPDEARARRDMVLRRMAPLGHDIRAALQEPLTASAHPQLPPLRHPAFLQATRAWLEQHLPTHVVYGAGLEVFSSMDLLAQQATEATIPTNLSVVAGMVTARTDAPLEAATALIDVSSGLLVATYGGTQATATDFNRATQSRRQAGSSIKPLVYALALSELGEGGLPTRTAASTINNQPRTFPGTSGWRPRNVGAEYSDTVTLAQGLTWSVNVATASLLEELGGPEPLIQFADRVGFDVAGWPVELGLSLGQSEVTPLEMARFVGTIANGGVQASGRPVIAVRDAAGQLRVPPPKPGRQVMATQSAALTRDLMRLVINSGTGGRSRGTAGIPGYTGQAMGKTGTTDSEKDLWFVGSSPVYAGAVWVGHDQPTRVGASASDIAAPLWGWWMRAVHEGMGQPDFPGPRLTHRRTCTLSGQRPHEDCTVLWAPYLPGTHPKQECTLEHELEDEVPGSFQSMWNQEEETE